MSRVLKRPIGGWGARPWRREVAQWLAFALVALLSWAGLNSIYATIGVVAELVSESKPH